MKEYNEIVESFAQFASVCYFGQDDLASKTFFDLFTYQKDLIDIFEREEQVICKKFRQGGFSSLTYLYLWYKLYNSKEPMKALIVSNKINYSNFNLKIPNSIAKDSLKIRSNFSMSFNNSSSLKIISYNEIPNNLDDCDYLVFDEPAFNKNMDSVWEYQKEKKLKGKFFVISNPGNANNEWSKPNWFYKAYNDVKKYYINPFFKDKSVPYVCEFNVHCSPLFDSSQINKFRKCDYFENEYLGEFNHKKENFEIFDVEPSMKLVEKFEIKNNTEFGAKIHEKCLEYDKLREKYSPIRPVLKDEDLLINKKELETKESLKQRLDRAGYCNNGNYLKELDIPKDLKLNNKEIYEDLAEKMPEPYKETYQEIYNKIVEEEVVYQQDNFCLFTEEKLLNKLKKMILNGLPKEIDIIITRDCLKINGVPTKISGKSIEYLFKGLNNFDGEEYALKEVSSKVRKKLQKLF